MAYQIGAKGNPSSLGWHGTPRVTVCAHDRLSGRIRYLSESLERIFALRRRKVFTSEIESYGNKVWDFRTLDPRNRLRRPFLIRNIDFQLTVRWNLMEHNYIPIKLLP